MAASGDRCWYRKYAATEMKDVHYCFSFILDPLTWHSKTKKIVVPSDIKGMKVRPSQATVAAWVTLLGGTNVQASATEVRDVMEKGVAEAVNFPWGSVPLLGVDKVTKYHMDAPINTVMFQWLMNPRTYNAMSPAQQKVIDDHCTTEWAGKFDDPWVDFEHAGSRRSRPSPGTRFTISPMNNSASGRNRPSRFSTNGPTPCGRRRRSRYDHERAEGVAGAIQSGLLIGSAANMSAGRLRTRMVELRLSAESTRARRRHRGRAAR